MCKGIMVTAGHNIHIAQFEGNKIHNKGVKSNHAFTIGDKFANVTRTRASFVP